MSENKQDMQETDVSDSVESEKRIDEESEKNLERAIKKGLSAPYAKVLVRLLLSLLLVSSLGLFITGVMRYNEFQRQKEVLLEKREELEVEIEELTFLLDQPVDYDYIVRVAREKLGLHLPDEIVYYNDYNEAE